MAEQNGNKTEEYRDELGRFTKGNPGGGRPKGSESFKTKWRKFIEKVAEDTDKTPDEIDHEMYMVALSKAREGDYQFYRDIQDRVFGKPQQSIDHTTAGEPLFIQSDLMDKYGISNTTPKPD